MRMQSHSLYTRMYVRMYGSMLTQGSRAKIMLLCACVCVFLICACVCMHGQLCERADINNNDLFN